MNHTLRLLRLCGKGSCLFLVWRRVWYLIKSILEGGDITLTFNKLLAKGTELVKILSDNRMRVAPLKGKEWEAFLKQKKGTQKVVRRSRSFS